MSMPTLSLHVDNQRAYSDLAVRIRSGAPLSTADQETILAAIERQACDEHHAWIQERLEAIVAILFPNGSSRSNKHEDTVHWPDSSWWNCPSIESSWELDSGDWTLSLSSYVGGGEYDEIDFVVPKAWLDAEDPTSLIHDACRSRKAEKEADEKARERALAEAEFMSAMERLKKLT